VIARRAATGRVAYATAARHVRAAVAATVFLVGTSAGASAFPVGGDQTVLPVGSELNEEALFVPREVFKSEVAGGAKSYLVKLGDMAFNDPGLFGGVARRAGISCNTCHINGVSNPKLYIPGASTRPGNFDTTGALFNPKADNHALDPVRIPSLRGARYLAPYGHDGRMASLRDFVRNVIVNEFAGPEPSPTIVDAIVAYIQDIDFLPNPRLAPGGHLSANASDAERRGEVLFARPFPHDPNLSCAGCHTPSSAFLDHQVHDVGSGGLFRTPTLINVDFNAPYFHDGRFDSFDQVVAHFDRVFSLGLSADEQQDLVTYLTAIGDGMRPYEHDGVVARTREINDFASVLDIAIPDQATDVISLTVDVVGGELRELTEQFPDWKDTSVSGGTEERHTARSALKQLVLDLRRVDLAASAGRFDDAAAAYGEVRKLMAAAIPAVLAKAEPWSLFNPTIHDAHYAALRELLKTSDNSHKY
jgi:cytochrome c peroxidase